VQGRHREEAMAASASFEEFYAATVDRLLA
jgi:hypothetical protein